MLLGRDHCFFACIIKCNGTNQWLPIGDMYKVDGTASSRSGYTISFNGNNPYPFADTTDLNSTTLMIVYRRYYSFRRYRTTICRLWVPLFVMGWKLCSTLMNTAQSKLLLKLNDEVFPVIPGGDGTLFPIEYFVSSSAQQRLGLWNCYKCNNHVTIVVTEIYETESAHCDIQSDTTRCTASGPL